MRPLIKSSVTADIILRQGTSQMRKAIGPAAATATATLLAQSSYCAAAFCQVPHATSDVSAYASVFSHHLSFGGSTRYFHTTAPTRKKRRNKWKSAKKYVAMMEESEPEENDSNDDMPRDASHGRKQKMPAKEEDQGVDKEESTIEEFYDDPPDSVVHSQTLDWIKQVVIGLNLCPFAASPLANKKLSIEIIRGQDAEAIAAAVLLELILRVDNPGTTVVVAPECSPDDFDTYLQVLNFIESVMEEHELVGKVQVAPFHPLFEFGGRSDESVDDDNEDQAEGIDNYTNRSPFPMFHVLREVEVGAAVDKLNGDASLVFDRNIKLMNMLYDKLGREGVEKVMSCEASDDDMKQSVEEVLKALKKTNDINV